MENAWFLESIADDGSRLRHPIATLPMSVGRDPGNDLVVTGRGLSRAHARIDSHGAQGLRLVDLGSTNGTFVNLERIEQERVLAENDVIHFGNAEYRLGVVRVTPSRLMDCNDLDDESTLIVRPGQVLSQKFVRQERPFMELLRGRGLSAAAQAIVDAHTGRVFGYELLGRSTHPELLATPVQLFQLAARLDREAELSEAFRDHGVRAITPRLNGARVFVNTHPKETFAAGFYAALTRLRAQQGGEQLVVEIHETAVMEVARMRDLAERLAAIDVPFAFDDFGAGQSRLNELADVPPHFVKFDMGLIRGLHEATAIKQRMVRDLVRMVLDLGSVPLAEGVELEDEAQVCREMGFKLLQGFLVGRPLPISSI